MAFLLVFVLSLHALTAHGFADSLVYCFEENGDVNIESTSDFSLGFAKKSDSHSDIDHSHTQSDQVIHASGDEHKDIDIGVFCPEENTITRSDFEKDIKPILIETYVIDVDYALYTSNSRFAFSYNPFFLDNLSESLSTIVLLI
ncbi:MAG: hypothetical protein RH860_00065 [Cytophagales bacterium]